MDIVRPERAVAAGLAWLVLASCACGQTDGWSETGLASFYAARPGPPFTAAHRRLPFGTRVLVRRIAPPRSVVVTILDRGPFIRGRVIDVSRAAAAKLDMIGSGVARVTLQLFTGERPTADVSFSGIADLPLLQDLLLIPGRAVAAAAPRWFMEPQPVDLAIEDGTRTR